MIILENDSAVKKKQKQKQKRARQLFWAHPLLSLGMESSLFWCYDLSTFLG